jgi:hypothetical protein
VAGGDFLFRVDLLLQRFASIGGPTGSTVFIICTIARPGGTPASGHDHL